MKYFIIILAVLLASCKTRHVAIQKEAFSDHSVIKKDSSSLSKTSDTTRTITRENFSSSDSSLFETKIYPVRGVPFTLKGDQTFTGTADSVVIKNKKVLTAQAQKAVDEKKGIDQQVKIETSERTKNNIDAKLIDKVIDSRPDPRVVVVAACLIALIGIVLFIAYKIRV